MHEMHHGRDAIKILVRLLQAARGEVSVCVCVRVHCALGTCTTSWKPSLRHPDGGGGVALAHTKPGQKQILRTIGKDKCNLCVWVRFHPPSCW